MAFLRIKYPCSGQIQLDCIKVADVSLRREISVAYNPPKKLMVLRHGDESELPYKVQVLECDFKNGKYLDDEESMLRAVGFIPPEWILSENRREVKLTVKRRNIQLRGGVTIVYNEPREVSIEDIEIDGFINIRHRSNKQKERLRLRSDSDELWYDTPAGRFWCEMCDITDVFNLHRLFGTCYKDN